MHKTTRAQARLGEEALNDAHAFVEEAEKTRSLVLEKTVMDKSNPFRNELSQIYE